jgi:type I restriction enzyme R subunit
MIEQDLRDDPYAQERFSKLLRQAIEEAEHLFDHPLKQYMLFHGFEEQVKERKLDDIPDKFGDNQHAQAYYGLFKRELPETFGIMDEQAVDTWVKRAFEVDDIVERAVAEHSINPENIEAEIRKQLLTAMFKACKSVGGGIEQAKRIVEQVVQITRVGLSGAQD